MSIEDEKMSLFLFFLEESNMKKKQECLKFVLVIDVVFFVVVILVLSFSLFDHDRYKQKKKNQ